MKSYDVRVYADQNERSVYSAIVWADTAQEGMSKVQSRYGVRNLIGFYFNLPMYITAREVELETQDLFLRPTGTLSTKRIH